MMISEGCQISARDKLGRTPLHYATATAQYQCVLSLVANGASLTVTDNFKRTPLHYAATSDGDAKSVLSKLLIWDTLKYGHLDKQDIFCCPQMPCLSLEIRISH